MAASVAAVLGKVRSWQRGRLIPSVHWGLDVPSGILPIGDRTTLRHRGSSDFPCITRGSSSGLGFPNRPVFSRWEQNGGWTLFGGIRLWRRDVGLMQTNLDVLDQYTLSLQGTASTLIEKCLGARDFPAASGPPRFRSDGGDGAVAALAGSAMATLSGLSNAGLISPYWTLTVFVIVCS